jgi:putative transposase
VLAKFEVPDGWCVQAFRFTLDPTDDQARALARHFGARRKAFNWTVATLEADIEAWHATGVETAKPSLAVLRKRWNTVKDQVCVNAETGQVWWPECSKEAYADGIRGAVDAYWSWQTSRAGTRARQARRVPALQTQRPRRRSGLLDHRRHAGRARPPPSHAPGHRDRPHPRKHPAYRTPH